MNIVQAAFFAVILFSSGCAFFYYKGWEEGFEQGKEVYRVIFGEDKGENE